MTGLQPGAGWLAGCCVCDVLVMGYGAVGSRQTGQSDPWRPVAHPAWVQCGAGTESKPRGGQGSQRQAKDEEERKTALGQGSGPGMRGRVVLWWWCVWRADDLWTVDGDQLRPLLRGQEAKQAPRRGRRRQRHASRLVRPSSPWSQERESRKAGDANKVDERGCAMRSGMWRGFFFLFARGRVLAEWVHQ